jgi:hypothetical protein
MKKSSIFVAIGFAISISGCKKSEDEAAERAVEQATGGKAKVDSKTGSVEVKTKDPSGKETNVQFGPGSKVPDDFPKEVPIYPGSKVMSAVSLAEGKNGHLLTLTTPDQATTVIEYYKKNLAGFKPDSELGSGGDGTMLMMSNAEITVSIAVSRSDDETMVQLTVNKRTPN